MTKKMRTLLARKQEIITQARGIIDAADAAGVDMTAEQMAQHKSLMASLDTLNVQIANEQRLADEEASLGALTLPDGTPIQVGHEQAENDPKRGFANYGEFVKAVQAAGLRQGQDQRLMIGAAAPSTYGNEGSLQDGGFLIPPEFSNAIYMLSLEGDAILPLTDNTPVTGNTMAFPADETTPWGGTGIQAYWEGEGNAATPTKASGRIDQMRLSKLMALVPVTDELSADAGALGAFLTNRTGQAVRWKINDALVNGDGAGKPKGIAVAGSLVTVLKEAGQSADTVVKENIAKMFSRMLTGSMGNAVWMMNSDTLPQLLALTLGQNGIFTLPQAGWTGAPGGFLLGRPIMFSEHCKTLGDLGDIYLVDWKQYRTITKASGIETATSMHLYFDAGLQAFRVTFRIDGQPALKNAVSPANGTNTKSAFVTLEARA